MKTLTIFCLSGAALFSSYSYAEVYASDLKKYPDLEIDTRLTATYLTESDPSLGLGGAGDSDRFAGVLQPRLKGDLSENWYVYAYAEFFVANETVELDEEFSNSTSDGYSAMREVWFDYRGFSRYPGESIRFGLERLRDPGSLWWDTEIFLTRWNLDTTLLQATIGVGEKGDYLRTDDIKLNEDEESRLRAFSSVSYQAFLDHWIGFKLLYSQDRNEVADQAYEQWQEVDNADRDLLWFGVNANNGYYESHGHTGLEYTVDLIGLAGESSSVSVTNNVIEQRSNDVEAWAVDTGLRMSLGTVNPIMVGAMFARGSGGSEEDTDNTFQQSGLQTNRSNFTGTRTKFARFGEATKAELTNIQAATVYISQVYGESFDWSLVAHHLQRVETDAPVILNGIRVPAVPGETELGTAYDLVGAYYLNPSESSWLMDSEWFADSFIRLRVGYFEPGKAFDYVPDNGKYRVILDLQKIF